MNFQEISDQVDREMAEEREAHAAWKARRKLFLEHLLGGADPLTWQMPAEIDDFDALLAQHAAQLRNVVRYMMGEALSDDQSSEAHVKAAGALTRMIQTNIAIARTLVPKDAKSKTVRGGAPVAEPQD